MTTIHAEMAADGGQLVLIAGGLSAGPEDLALAARRLKTLTPLFSASDPKGALVAPLSWAAVVQLSSAFGAWWSPGPRLRAWVAEQVTRRTAPEMLLYRPPAGLTPYPWQSSGAAMIAAAGGALITDEPGCGKTATAILGLVEHAARTDQSGPVVVVCPASVIDPWVDAWATWAPHVRAVAWRGSPKKRDALAGTADVYVVSYETARQDAGVVKHVGPLRTLHGTGPVALVVDECHLIKNAGAARTKAVKRMADIVAKNGGAVVALSGTPITHHPADLWPALACIDPGAWPARERWVARYCEVVPGDYDDEIIGLAPATEPEFRTTMLGQLRRVAKADVLAELPPKVYSVRTVDVPAKWRKVYDDFESSMLAELPDDNGGVVELSVFDTLQVLGHLRQLSAAAADVEVTHGPDVDEQTGEPKRHVHLELKAPSWKVDALLEVLAERCGAQQHGEGGQQVVAFGPSAQLMRLAGAAATVAGYRVGYVIGGQPPAERSATVAAFQAGELDVICATTGAGGVGITLTAARTVVFLQRPWSLVESIQAEDRCHRIGSERHDSIEVIDIVARNTLDTRVRAVLRERAGQLADLVQDPRIVTELLGGSGVTDSSTDSGLHKRGPRDASTVSTSASSLADGTGNRHQHEESLMRNKPLRFNARCNLTRVVLERNMTPDQHAEATAAGVERRFREMESERVDPEKRKHGRWEYDLPACEGFATTDPAEFETHMLHEHGRKPATHWARTDGWAPFADSIRAGHRAPRLLPDGRPLITKANVRTCAGCGLIAEVDSNASELWWAEHERGCQIAQVAS